MNKKYVLPLLMLAIFITLSFSVSAYYEADRLQTSSLGGNYIYGAFWNGTTYTTNVGSIDSFYSFDNNFLNPSYLGANTQVTPIGMIGNDEIDYYNWGSVMLGWDWDDDRFVFYNNTYDVVGLYSVGSTACDTAYSISQTSSGTIKMFCGNGIVYDFNNDYSSDGYSTFANEQGSYGFGLMIDDKYVFVQQSAISGLMNITFNIYDELGYFIENRTTQVTLASGGVRSLAYNEDDNELMLTVNSLPAPTSYFFANVTTGYSSGGFTFDGDNYSAYLCVDENVLCSDSSYNYDSYSDVLYINCPDPINDAVYCGGGCTNSLINNTLTGACEFSPCVNECELIGLATCFTPNSFRSCGNWDSDACLEYGIVEYCDSGDYCSATNLGDSCSNVSTTNTNYVQDSLTVQLDLSSTTGTISEQGTSPATYGDLTQIIQVWLVSLFGSTETTNVETVLSSLNTSFETEVYKTTTSQDFFAYDCDYSEEQVFTDTLTTVNGWTGDYTHNISGDYTLINTTTQLNKTVSQKDNSRFNTIISFEDTGTYNVSLTNDNDYVTNLEFDYNSVTHQLIVTETLNNQIIYNYTATSNNIEYISLSLAQISSIDNLNIKVSIFRSVGLSVITEDIYALPLLNPTGSNANKIVYTSSGERLEVIQLRQVSVSDYPIYNLALEQQKTFECVFTESVCKNVVVYGNEYGLPTYYFSDVHKVCMNEDGELVSSTSIDTDSSVVENYFGKDWSDKEKLLYSTLFILLIFGFFVGAGLFLNDKTPIIIGGVVSGLLLVYAVLEGFIPAWIILIFIAIGSLIATAIVTKPFNGGQ